MCSLEGQLQELDGANKELTDLRYKLEASIRELNVKHKTTEEVIKICINTWFISLGWGKAVE